jgi:transcriptional regulator with XRE-family HTH domain
MTNIRDIFAHNLKVKRQKYGITQAKLAEKVGVSTHHIAMIEIARHYPTLELVERIANTLEIEIYELFTAKPTPENSMERLHQSIVQNIDKVVAEAVERAFSAKLNDGQQRN